MSRPKKFDFQLVVESNWFFWLIFGIIIGIVFSMLVMVVTVYAITEEEALRYTEEGKAIMNDHLEFLIPQLNNEYLDNV